MATIAAVGVGGVATAQDNSPLPISLPDVGLSGLGGDAEESEAASAVSEVADPGELLRTRILSQAASQQASADAADREDTEAEAASEAKRAAAEKVREAAAKKAAEKKAAAKTESERKAKAQAKADAERQAASAGRFVAPTSNYTLTAYYGQAGANWSADHTGLDFAAPSGTAVVSVAKGEITSAGWAGSYGYRVIVTHADGTQTWYCHLSSMVKTSGAVAPGDTIGRVGATGNVTGPHLHLEVRPGGSNPIDPAAWLRSNGVSL